MKELLQRHSANPLITPEMVKPSRPDFRVRGVFNPGATRFGDEILLLLRVAEDVPTTDGSIAVPIAHGSTPEEIEILTFPAIDALEDSRELVTPDGTYLTTLSHLRLARSKDGVSFTVDEEPFLFPGDPSEKYGVEDARITRIDDRWWINYTAVSGDGFATALASTRDFVTVERHGLIFHPENKDVCLFPAMVDGSYHAFHRPNNGFGKASIWYARSPDLHHWGHHQCLMRPRQGVAFESEKIGGGAPPVETEEGWLHIYHGACREHGYGIFAVLTERDHPARIISRSPAAIFTPQADCEREGFFDRVVFCNGVVAQDDGRLLVYYGASDETSCLAEGSLDEILASLR